jgi:hypothetical protein
MTKTLTQKAIDMAFCVVFCDRGEIYLLCGRGLHEVSCEGKVSAQGVMKRTRATGVTKHIFFKFHFGWTFWPIGVNKHNN